MRRTPHALLITLALGSAAAQQAGTQQTGTRTVTLYTTVNRAVAEAVTAAFQARTGITVTLKTGNLPADLTGIDAVWLNDTGLNSIPATRLARLPTDLTAKSRVNLGPQWLATHARYHTLAYSRDRVQAATLPTTLLNLPAHTELRGRVGWAVASPAFTDLTAALLATHGENVTRAWLTGMIALNPRDYGSEVSALTQAVQDGELDVALTTHPFVQRVRGAGYRVAAAWMQSGDPGNLMETGAAAVLRAAPHPAQAYALLRALAQPETGLLLYASTFDQPLTTGPLNPGGLIPPEQLAALGPNPDRAAWQERARDLLIELDLY
ncbi:hypothetical protein [Deinococcus depolymerans]|uniref:Iron ABC transporter substrate-binding protein n=1 Tax=Deinococcus depolymerans TaxID=392408 RepID=A0ABN1BX86_9DEIO